MAVLAALAGIAALFNIANLVPVWKFDGGQVLRQIFTGQLMLAIMSFLTLSAFLALGRVAGLPTGFLAITGIVFAILSLITAGSGVKPRYELRPLVGFERVALAAAFAAVFAVHSYGVLWAVGCCCEARGAKRPTQQPPLLHFPGTARCASQMRENAFSPARGEIVLRHPRGQAAGNF